MSYALPPLPYPADALEPFYDRATVELHHGKHHAAYVAALNEALADHPGLAERTVEELIADPAALPDSVRWKVLNQGGGHANHSLFWRTLAPRDKREGGGMEGRHTPSGDLAAALSDAFGGFAGFKEQFTASAGVLFGSGWTWLAVDGSGGFRISNLQNQESPLNNRDTEGTPILALDLWEHAYYLKFQNRRPEWIAAWWNLVNWDEVAKLHARVLGGASLADIYAA